MHGDGIVGKGLREDEDEEEERRRRRGRRYLSAMAYPSAFAFAPSFACHSTLAKSLAFVQGNFDMCVFDHTVRPTLLVGIHLERGKEENEILRRTYSRHAYALIIRQSRARLEKRLTSKVQDFITQFLVSQSRIDEKFRTCRLIKPLVGVFVILRVADKAGLTTRSILIGPFVRFRVACVRFETSVAAMASDRNQSSPVSRRLNRARSSAGIQRKMGESNQLLRSPDVSNLNFAHA
ncbi:hypothetical protein EAG_09506 [Camponotus floridanus]|uniref:Uncharacterized protein n=1 Tax=Camponotus floridanus TaxID=104421 RepID=E1ZZ74_CAMFO|nr:hypothetical protein EAG_09506 [Camponotus floridanus]